MLYGEGRIWDAWAEFGSDGHVCASCRVFGNGLVYEWHIDGDGIAWEVGEGHGVIE
jgi:hypothetical protein